MCEIDTAIQLYGGRRMTRQWLLSGTRSVVLAALLLASMPIWLVAVAAANEVARVQADGVQKPVPQHGLLPQPLTVADVALYQRIFDVQQAGKWRSADQLIKRLESELLLGDVMAQRYLHPTKYRSKFKELQAWLRQYADHPDATRIYRLAVRRRPPSGGRLRAPTAGYLNGNGADITRVSSVDKMRRQPVNKLGRSVLRQVDKFLGRGYPTGALKYLRTSKAKSRLAALDYADAMARVARGYFVFGKDKEALEAAEASLKAGSGKLVLVNWTAGLAAWRLADYAAAAKYFSDLGRATASAPADRAAGAYWASRAFLVLRQPAEATSWLVTAALNRDTFYGLLARRALGVEIPIDWDLPGLETAAIKTLSDHPNGRRALALLQINRDYRAERHLRKMAATVPETMRTTIMTVAARAGMPGLSIRMAALVHERTGRIYHAAMYPVPRWQPIGGFKLDRALILAIIRQESYFNPRAKSRRGARGLMQLMPRTAAFIGDDKALRRDRDQVLYDPAFNMTLGQSYIDHLLGQQLVRGDLFLLLAAYNAGPGSLARWRRKVDFRDDPLLFIESIPSPETRGYIESVLTNMWMYRLQLRQSTPALDRVAAGIWPQYQSIDDENTGRIHYAWN